MRTYTSEEFEAEAKNWFEGREPVGRPPMIHIALKIAAAVTREGVIEGVMAGSVFKPEVAAAIRRALTEVEHG